MHCTAVDEVNIRGEVFAIDATYKVDDVEMRIQNYTKRVGRIFKHLVIN